MVRHKLMFKALVMFAITGVIILILAIPMFISAGEKSQKIVIRRQEEKSLQEKVGILSRLDKTVLESRLAVIDAALLPRKDVVAYLSAIDGLARELGLSFGGLSLTPGNLDQKDQVIKNSRPNTGGLQSLESTIKIQGGSEAIYAFLRSVEQMLPLMQLTDVKVDKDADDQLSLSVNLGMLWAPSDANTPKGVVTLFTEAEESQFQTLSTYRRYTSVAEALPVESGMVKNDLFAP